MKRNCKYCKEIFKARRRNHIYCCNSCKTLASYKRNEYKYIAGHYQKQTEEQPKTNIAIPTKTETAINLLEDRVKKMDKINSASITNSAIGALAVSTALHSAKKIFAPNSLPATKGDVETLKKEINELKYLLKVNANSLF